MRPLLFCCLLFSGFAFFMFRASRPIVKPAHPPLVIKREIPREPAPDMIRMQSIAAKAKKFTDQNSYCKQYCFLIDMSLPSGKKRFFVYDLQNDSMLTTGMVTHGSGSETNTAALVFSNVVHSNATSLGKYRIGEKYHGKFGLAFKLYGMDASNSKAYARAVVLHAHECVPAEEVYPQPICASWGCPTVSPSFLNVLEKYLDDTEDPVLLWIYY